MKQTNSDREEWVSLITPTYHSAKMLNYTMKSILEQSNKRFEWIVVAGDESEETKEVLTRYSGTDLVVLQRPPKGIYDAVKAGFDAAKHQIIYWINAGDILMPYAIDRVIGEAGDQNFKWWTGSASLRNEDVQLIRIDPRNDYNSNCIKLGFYGKHMPWLQQESIFFRKEVLNDVDLERFSKFRFAGDYFLFHSFSKNGIQLKSLGYMIASFTRHEGQISENQVMYWKEVESFAGSYITNIVTHPVSFLLSLKLLFKFLYKRMWPN